jgi:hypothetical protein
MVGHGKLDPEYTLGQRPDLVISCRSYQIAAGLPTGARTTDVVLSFLAAPFFQRYYRPNPINETFTMGRTAIYTYLGSREFAHRDWKSVQVSP